MPEAVFRMAKGGSGLRKKMSLGSFLGDDTSNF